MTELIRIPEKESSVDYEVIKIEKAEWLFNSGIVGILNILSFNQNQVSSEIKIHDTHIEFPRSIFKDFTDTFFEYAFRMHGKYDSIKEWLKQVVDDINALQKNERFEQLGKKYYVENPTAESLTSKLVEDIIKRWKGVTYESFKKIKKSEIKSSAGVLNLLNELLKILDSNREAFVQKEVQTFLRGIIGERSFLNKNVPTEQKEIFKKDFETPLLKNKNKVDKTFNCIHCNSRKAKAGTIFSAGLVFYQGLNEDSLNFSWGFNPNLPLCEICEFVYFCHWAGYTKSFQTKSYLFVNDDSSVQNLRGKNQLLSQVLNKDKKENLLISYFYQLLEQEEYVKSDYSLQNISIIEADLEAKVMPKVLSLHVSRNQARFIKSNHEKLKSLSNKRYTINKVSTNVLHEFLQLLLRRKLNFSFVNRLAKYYLQYITKPKGFVKADYFPYTLQQVVSLITDYFKTVNQKSLNMEAKQIWYIYSLGNNMRSTLTERQAENKINGLAYRLLNAVRANDRSTFLNVLLRLYIGYGQEVPKTLVTILESEEKFQIIGHSYINGLLGEALSQKTETSESIPQQ